MDQWTAELVVDQVTIILTYEFCVLLDTTPQGAYESTKENDWPIVNDIAVPT